MRAIARKLKAWMQPEKRHPSSGTPPLDEGERGTLFALFEAVAAHRGFPRERFERFLDSRPDLGAECRAASALLDCRAGERFKGLAFATLTSDARATVLDGMLRKYPYRSSHAPILDRLGLTADNLDLLVAGREVKAFRQFVVREFLGFYYDEPEGWLVGGYEKARGHALEEAGEAEVIAVAERGGRLWLELGDGTFEEYDETTPDGESGEVVWVKGGRQRARLSPDARERLDSAQASVPESRRSVDADKITA